MNTSVDIGCAYDFKDAVARRDLAVSAVKHRLTIGMAVDEMEKSRPMTRRDFVPCMPCTLATAMNSIAA
jgi:hypothetical protein